MNTTELIEIAKECNAGENQFGLYIFKIDELAKFAELLAKRNAATADYIAYLYRDSNGTLKLAQETPPPDNAFPVFTTNIQFLDVARLVLDDNVDLIIEHGGVKLWEALVKSVNASYTSPQQSNALEMAAKVCVDVGALHLDINEWRNCASVCADKIRALIPKDNQEVNKCSTD